MVDNELLQAISQMMDEKLSKVLDEKLEPIKTEQRAIRKDIQTIKHDVKEMSFKLDVVYDWVDGIDLKVKNIDDRTA